MDIQSLRTLLEIQALQTLGSSGNPSSNSLTDNNNSIFSDMIGELLSEATTSSNAKMSSLLGLSSSSDLSSYFAGLTNTTDRLNQLGDFKVINSEALQSLLYKGSNAVYIPSSVYDSLSQSNNSSNTTLESYVSDDVIGSTAYEKSLAGANKYAAIIKQASITYNVPEKLIAAVMKQESNFNPTVVSHAGAQGLMQLMPKTAQYLGVSNALDPEQNIMAGAKYLRQMLDQFDNDPTLALAAYNAGPSNVTKYDGIPPFKETQNYVTKVMNYFTA